jgi:antagonist of KipI
MSLLVFKPGILTTVQDLGRTGYRSLGINPGGVMDRTAARLVNTLLGSDASEAVLEMHFTAGEFVFETEISFAIGGADFGALLNGRELRNWSVASANKGDVLKFSERRIGNRAYLAVAGGFRIDEWLGSKSTNLVASAGGFQGRKLAAGDRIEFVERRKVSTKTVGPSIVPRYSRFPTVRIIAGAEFDLLTAISERRLLNSAFTVTNESNRMGYRLSGDPLHLLDAKEMVSAAVSFGTIQLLPDGQLIVLMADHQTSGGYPRIGNVIEADLPLLAQLGPGDGVSFHLVTIEEAERELLEFARELNILRVGVALNR